MLWFCLGVSHSHQFPGDDDSALPEFESNPNSGFGPRDRVGVSPLGAGRWLGMEGVFFSRMAVFSRREVGFGSVHFSFGRGHVSLRSLC